MPGRQSGRVLGCTNAGEVTARKDVGGIVGQVEAVYLVERYPAPGLGEVQSQLYRLESLLRTTLGDFGDSQAEARALMQQILELLGNCSDIIGGMYPDIPWPTPGDDGGSDTGDAGGGSRQRRRPAPAMTPPADGSIRAAAQWTISPIIFSRSYVFSAR